MASKYKVVLGQACHMVERTESLKLFLTSMRPCSHTSNTEKYVSVIQRSLNLLLIKGNRNEKNKTKARVGEMAQLVNCLLHKHENLNSSMAVHVCIRRTRETETEGSI